MFSTTQNTLQLIRRDKDTLEVKEIVDAKNTLTLYGEDLASEGNLRYYAQNLAVSTLKTIADVPTLPAFVKNEWIINSSNNSDWSEVIVGDRIFWETSRRFDPPALGTTRDINTVGITDQSQTSQNAFLIAYAALDNTFVQQDTDTLDIVYRIEFVGDYLNGSSYTMSTAARRNVARAAMRNGSHPDAHNISYLSVRGDGGSKLTALKPDSDAAQIMVDASTPFTPPYYEYFESVLAKSSWVGRLLKSYVVYDQANADTGSYVWGNLFDSGFPHKPVQVIHNHSSSAISPFLDVNHLATGTGSLAFDATNWDLNTPFCDWYYINIEKGGETGTAQYTYSKRVGITGFSSTDTYMSASSNAIPWLTDANKPQLKFLDRTIDAWITYPWVTAYESNGVSILNLDTGAYRTWSATSETNIQAFTMIWQITTDELGNIWVADRVQGLYKITDPVNTGVITKIPTSSGIPSNGGCYGVCEGYNGKIWAAFDGGICVTDDKGASWTVYGPQYLDYSASLPNGTTISPHLNQARIVQLQCDIESPNNRLTLLIDNRDISLSNPFLCVWWSNLESCIHKDYPVTGIGWDDDNGRPTGIKDSIGNVIPVPSMGYKPSRRGGVWIQFTTNGYSSYLSFNQWGSEWHQSGGQIGSAKEYPYPNYWYSNQGEPAFETDIATNATTDSQTLSSPSVMSQTGFYVQTRRSDLGATTSTLERWQLSNSAKLALAYRSSKGLSLISPDSVGTPTYSSNVPLDSFGGRHTKGRDYSILDYRWNPSTSAFELNYAHPCTDSGTNSLDLPRHGFDVQSHTFTGNSSIDATTLLANGLTDDAITLCASIKPEPEEHFNGTIQTLLSLDTYTLHRDTLGDIQDNAIYWDVRESARYGQEKTQSALGSLRIRNDVNLTPSVTLSTAGPADSLAQPVRMVATLERDPVAITRPTMLFTNNSIRDSHVYDDSIRSLSWLDESASAGGAAVFNISPNEVKEYTDFSFRYRVGDDFANDNLHSQHSLRASLGYGHGNHPLNIQLNRAADDNSRHVSAWITPSGPRYHNMTTVQSFTTADRDGTNLIDVRFHTLDNGQNWQIDVRRVNNPGNSETYTTLYTTTQPKVLNKKYGYNAGGTKAPNFQLYLYVENSGNTGTVRQYYKDLDFRDNTTNTSLWTNTISHSKFTGKVYLDGVLHSTSTWYEGDHYRNRATTPNPMADFAFGSNSRVRPLTLGAQKFITTDNYYRGTMENVQFWNVVFDQADVTADQTAADQNPTGVTATKPAANLVAHYPMNEDLDGKEAKPTHAASEVFDNNLSVAFTDGSTSPSWVATDFYTVGVTDGVLKDNATSFNLRKDLFTKPINETWNYLESSGAAPGVMATQVPAVSNTSFWEPVTFSGFTNSSNSYVPRYQAPAMIGTSNNNIDSTSINYSSDRHSLELLNGDGEYQFRVATDKITHCRIAFTAVPSDLTATKIPTAQVNQSLYISFSNTAATFTLFAAGTQAFPDRAYTAGDLFRFVRVGSVFTVYHNADIVFTIDADGQLPWDVFSPVLLTLTMSNTEDTSTAFYDFKLKTRKTRPELQLGNISTQSGRYATNYATFATQEKYWEFNLNGAAPANVHWWTPSTPSLRAMYSIPALAAGDIAVLPYHGVILFSPDDVGKSFQVNCVLVERK